MFTHEPVTPIRLEVLIDLLRGYGEGLPRKDVYRLLQPRSIDDAPAAVEKTVDAGIQLMLLRESGKSISLSPECRKPPEARAAILAQFDERVLASMEVEKYFALYYSFYLARGKSADDSDKAVWADHFSQAVFGDEPQGNRFNETKLTGLHRWLSYVGLGWYDPREVFQANPYDRVERSLGAIFKKGRVLESSEFIKSLGQACPELDGGKMFMQANKGYDLKDMRCTLGLSHALIELHLDKVIRLDCSSEGSGWSIRDAEPLATEGFKSGSFIAVELLGRN